MQKTESKLTLKKCLDLNKVALGFETLFKDIELAKVFTICPKYL